MKTLSQGLVLTILFAISIFFAITYVNTYVLPQPNTESQQINIPEKIDNDKPITPEPVESEIFFSTFPREAKELNLGEKINNFGGYGKESLCNYFVIGQFIYIIFTTDSNSCDVRANAVNLAVAKLDLDATIIDILTIKSDSNVIYKASNLFDYGIIIVANVQNSTVIYAVTEELNCSKLIMPYNSDKCLLRYCYPYSIILLTQNTSLTALSIDSSLNINFSISSTFDFPVDILDCFYLNNYYIFANINNIGTAIQFDNRGFIKSRAISTDALSEVMPTEKGYLLSTIKEGIAYLNWVDRDFSLTSTTTLSAAKNIKLAFTGKGYLAITYGDIGECKSYFVCRHGDIISRNDTDLCNIKQITDIIYGNGNVIITALIHNTNNTAVMYEFDTNHYCATPIVTTSGISSIDIYGAVIKNKSILLYTTTQNSLTHIDNWGGQDIFIRVVDN